MAKKIKVNIEADLGDAIKDVNKLNESVEDLNESVGETSKGLSKVGNTKDSLDSVSKGFKGVGLAMKAAGIGLIIAAFAALKEILEKQQPVLDFVDTAFTAIGLGVTAVSNALKEVYQKVSKSTEGFDALGKVMKGIFNIVLTPFQLAWYGIQEAIVNTQLVWESSPFGSGDNKKIQGLVIELANVKKSIKEVGDAAIQSGKDIVNNVVEAAGEIASVVSASIDELSKIDAKAIIDQAKRTTELKKQAQIAEAINKGRLEQFDRLAEQQRQIRDDEFKSISDRIAANDELGLVLEKQQKLMLANAQISINAASLEFAANQTTENRVKLITAQNEKMAVLATIEGFRSEQIVNRIALEKEELELLQTSINGTAERAIIRRDADAEQITNDLLRINAQISNAQIEKETEEARLQTIVDNANAGTQAKVDAQQELLNKQLEFDIEAEELQISKDEIIKNRNDKNAADAKTRGEVEIANAKTVADTKKAIQDSSLSSVADGLSLLASLDEDNKALQAAAIIGTNAVGIAKTIITTQASNAATIAEGAALAIPTFGASVATAAGLVAANNISAGISIGTSIAATAKGLSALKKGGSAGSKPSLPGGGGGSASTSPISQESLFSTQNLDGAAKDEIGTGAGLNQQPIIKAVVLESDITNTQNTISKLKANSEFG